MATSESYSVPALLRKVTNTMVDKACRAYDNYAAQSNDVSASHYAMRAALEAVAAELTASSRQEGDVHTPASTGWMPIESAPKDGTYILIAECGLLPDIAAWCRELPERVDRHGTKYLARPEGWFDVSRSRLHPTHRQPLPEPPHED